MALSSYSLRFSDERTDDPFTEASFLQQCGLTVPVMTTVPQFVSILRKFNVTGPQIFGEIHLDNPQYYDRVGQGAQFTVFRSVRNQESGGVVVKRAFLGSPDDHIEPSGDVKTSLQRRLKTLETEIRALCHDRIRQHPNIVALTAWGYDYPSRNPQYPSPVLLVEEASFTLSSLLKYPKSQPLSTTSRYQLCLDTASGLECLRQCKIVHGDLKPDNILIFLRHNKKAPYLAKLADFGLCIAMESEVELTYSRYRSTWSWQPPEITDPSLSQSPVEPDLLYRCDSYSYGLLASSILFLGGKSPLGCSNRRMSSLIQQDIALSLSRDVDITRREKRLLGRLLQSIIAKFLSEDPKCRSLVSTEVFEDLPCQWYHDWLKTTATVILKSSTPRIAKSEKNTYFFWTRLSDAVLRQLSEDYASSLLHEPSLELPGDMLFGMALSHMNKSVTMRLESRDLTLDFCIAAVRATPPSAHAQAILPRLAAAVRPGWNLEEEFDVDDLLFQSGCRGSWFAAQQLADRNPEKSIACHRIHRLNGGFNKEALEHTTRHDRAEDFWQSPDPRSLLEIPLATLCNVRLTEFAQVLSFSSYTQAVDDNGNTLLHFVAMLGRQDLIDYIVERDGSAINKTNKAGETPLYKACAAGSTPAIRALLRLGADASITEIYSGISCLHWLCLMEEEALEDIAASLIRSGGSVQCRTKILSNTPWIHGVRNIEAEHFPFFWPHGTPLHWAVHVRSAKAARVLLDHGADIDAGDILEDDEPSKSIQKRKLYTPWEFIAKTPLGLAMYMTDPEMVSFLLRQGANPNIGEYGIAALRGLAGGSYDLDSRLRHWIFGGKWERSLLRARRCLTTFKEYGGLLNRDLKNDLIEDTGGSTALNQVASSGNGAIVLSLLEVGADPNIRDALSESTLEIWCGLDPQGTIYPDDYFNMLKTLINRSDLHSLDEQTQHSLLLSCLRTSGGTGVCKIRIETLLREVGIRLNFNARDKYLRSIVSKTLEMANRDGQDAVTLTTFLLELGAARDFRNMYNHDFIWCLADNLNMTDALCLKLLKDHLSGRSAESSRKLLNDSVCSRTGITAFMNFVRRARVGCVEFCLGLEIDLQAKDHKRRTAFDHALMAGDTARERLLHNWAMNRVGKPPPNEQFEDDILFENTENLWGDAWAKNFVPNHRERYFAYPTVIHLLAEAGATHGDDWSAPSPTFTDKNFIEVYKANWFVRNEQPFYSVWEPLYVHDRWQQRIDAVLVGFFRLALSQFTRFLGLVWQYISFSVLTMLA
ncbi:hypothetical protein F4678DRAFT_184018 [Xylaria arbuscula]|nr:hypothetical protein F4678DRAFT_184018 [Xylaria arbuscula]